MVSKRLFALSKVAAAKPTEMDKAQPYTSPPRSKSAYSQKPSPVEEGGSPLYKLREKHHIGGKTDEVVSKQM